MPTLTQNLLVSTDFSPASLLAIDAAAMLAQSRSPCTMPRWATARPGT